TANETWSKAARARPVICGPLRAELDGGYWPAALAAGQSTQLFDHPKQATCRDCHTPLDGEADAHFLGKTTEKHCGGSLRELSQTRIRITARIPDRRRAERRKLAGRRME